MKLLQIVSIVLSISFLILGCGSGGDDNGSKENFQSLGRLDITDAETLVLVSQNSSKASAEVSMSTTVSEGSDTLYKVTKDGLLIEVLFYDEQGQEISSDLYFPQKIIDLTENYLYIEFDWGRAHLEWYRFFVRKSDGAVFKAPAPRDFNDHVDRMQFFFTERTTATIGDGNIYYILSTCYECASLSRIDISGPSNPVDIQVSPSSDLLDRHGSVPLVDSSGNILYFGSAAGTVVRFIKPDGSMEDLSNYFPPRADGMSGFCDSGCTFLGPNGNIFYQYSESDYENEIYTTNILEFSTDDNGAFSTSLYGSFSGNPFQTKRYYLHLGNKVIGVNKIKGYSDDRCIITELYNSEGIPNQPVIDFSFDEIYDAQAGNAYYFLFGKKSDDGSRALYRINAATHEASLLTISSDYELYQIEVVSDNEVIFYALRYSDGADVIGTVNQLNEVEIISVVVGHPSVTLERVL